MNEKAKFNFMSQLVTEGLVNLKFQIGTSSLTRVVATSSHFEVESFTRTLRVTL